VVDLWQDCRRFGGAGALGMGALLALPCAGGVGDQPAALMDAFALLDAWSKEG
jgi:hypothetical protein